MTISTTIIKSGPYTGNDATTTFAYNFKLLRLADLKVKKITISTGAEVILTEGTDYTVTGVGADAGGSVSYPVSGSPLTTDEQIFLYSDSDRKQLVDLRNQGGYYPETIEDALDIITRIMQEIDDESGRTLILAIESAFSNLTLPDPVAGQFVKWAADLSGLENTDLSGLSPSPVTAFMSAALLAVDETEAATALGFVEAYLGGFQDLVLRSAGAPTYKTTLKVVSNSADRVVQLPDENAVLTTGAATSGHIGGLGLANDATDPNNDILVAAGSATSGTTWLSKAPMVLSAPLIKRLDAPWASGTNAGGLTTSLTKAINTWYHVFLIDLSGVGHRFSLTDVAFDTSPAGANIDTDLATFYKRRIGSVLTDGSGNIIKFSQFGDTFTWDIMTLDLSTALTATEVAGILAPISAPLGVKTKALVHADLTTAGTAFVLLSSPGQGDNAPSTNNCSLESSTAIGREHTHLSVVTDTSSQIRCRTNSAAGGTLNVMTVGWVDTRGKD